MFAVPLTHKFYLTKGDRARCQTYNNQPSQGLRQETWYEFETRLGYRAETLPEFFFKAWQGGTGAQGQLVCKESLVLGQLDPCK